MGDALQLLARGAVQVNGPVRAQRPPRHALLEFLEFPGLFPLPFAHFNQQAGLSRLPYSSAVQHGGGPQIMEFFKGLCAGLAVRGRAGLAARASQALLDQEATQVLAVGGADKSVETARLGTP